MFISSVVRLRISAFASFSGLICSFLLLGSLQAIAQSVQLSGTVRDPDQSLVADAIVTLTNVQTASTLRTTSDQSGHYTFESVTPGAYRLQAEKTGFANVVIPSLNIANGQSLLQDLSFTVARANTSVTVNAGISGTPAQGYYVANVDQGVMGTAPIVDQPFTITVLSADLIANTQVKSFRDAMKFLPLVSFTEQQGPEILRPATRGVQGSIAQNTRMDGMAIAITGANAMEQYQELQVENGLGASMYGPANPSGMFDFVLKRPTEERTANLYLEQDSSTVGTIYGDAGGRLGPHKIFGYRTNLLFGDGAQWVEGSNLRRRLAEFAFDLRPTNRTTIDTHYSVYDIVQRGYPGWFTYGPNKSIAGTTQDPSPSIILPTAPDPTRVGYGQSYAGVNLTTQSTSVRLLHDFSSNWHAMAGGLAQRLDRFIDTPVNMLTSNSGNYSSSLATGFAPRFGIESDLGYITGTLERWGIKQDIVIGSEGYRFNQYSYTSPPAGNVFLGTANISNPVIFAPPAVGLPKNVNIYQSSIVHQQGFNLGDLISFPKRFAVRLAASQDWIGVDNNSLVNGSPSRTGGSNKNGISPSVSVMYKPESSMTAYATYASSLQQGDIAPGGTVNANQSLAPYRSKEWELGFKTDGRPLNITTALFRLERPFANTVAFGNTGKTIFEIVGQQVNYGAEISGQGTLFHRLLIDGGFTALNARLNDTGVAATDGKRFVGIPPYHSNLYSEYRIPGIANLTVTGDWQFTGRRIQDDENLHFTNGFNTFDVGFRYSHILFTKLATLRFGSQNIGNSHYYSTISAGDITGTNASSNTAHLGAPRTIATSLQIAF
ncbi:iron complex outermembrane receptor protein [Silvibacterium bohemicum]|uniref:Iron complex outermembrane receptor protein n=1 Tax=Silvibacterium bohemicum TaxID=1577686 RepID=A0A841JV62_9BACT|nr:TonB-dependent receptor [Silvibacterium bohemicum]MBB6144425.1 iron complex outermembrane receptor protein [Silvibacterium bohemicum]